MLHGLVPSGLLVLLLLLQLAGSVGGWQMTGARISRGGGDWDFSSVNKRLSRRERRRGMLRCGMLLMLLMLLLLLLLLWLLLLLLLLLLASSRTAGTASAAATGTIALRLGIPHVSQHLQLGSWHHTQAR